jgi:hypothetical protein
VDGLFLAFFLWFENLYPVQYMAALVAYKKCVQIIKCIQDNNYFALDS